MIAAIVLTGFSLPATPALAEHLERGAVEASDPAQPDAGQPAAEEPAADVPVVQESVAVAPVAEEPLADVPAELAPAVARAVGDMAATVDFVSNPAGASIDELVGSFDSRADAETRLFGLNIGYSCGPASSCESAQIKIDPLPLDPFYNQYRFAGYSSVTLPAGATFSGAAATGFTVKLGTLNPGTSGSFVMLFDYQARGVGVSAQSFFPDGAVIPATATISAANQDSFSVSDSVVWHIATPEPGVAFAPTAVARVGQDYTYTDYMSAGCQWGRSSAGHGEPVFECAASYAVRHTIPAGADFVSASNGGSYDAASGIVTWAGSGASAALGWGLLSNLGTPRTVTVRFPESMVADPDNCVIQVTTSIAADVIYLSGASKSVAQDRVHEVNACVPFSSGSAEKSSTRNLGTAADPIVWATMANSWTVRLSNRSNVPAVATVVDNALDQPGLPVTRITTTGGAAAITATLDNGAVVQVTSSDYTAPTGRRIVSATAVTAPIPGPNKSVSNQELVITADVRFHYTVEANVPAEGYERTNAASVTMGFPGTPELAVLDLGTAEKTVEVFRRPATLSPTISAVVAGGGNPVAGTVVTYTMRGSSSNMDATTDYKPQYVFVAPADWNIIDGSAAIPGLPDAIFSYRTIAVGGESRHAVFATRPDGTVWGVNEAWPNMTVKATPAVSAAANSLGVAQFYQGDAGHNFGPTTAIWGATAGTTFGAYRYQDAADLDGDSDRTEHFAYAVSSLRVGASAQISVLKEICYPDTAQADGCAWRSNPDEPVGVAPDAASVSYRVTITNAGSTALSNVVAYDVLPYPGDTGTSSSSAANPRGSTFREELASIGSNGGMTLGFSTSTNPARAEVHPGSGGVDDWNSTAAGAQAIRAIVPATLAAGASRSFTYVASIVGAPAAGELACNSVAVASQSTPVVEPRPVCAIVEEGDLEADGPATIEAQLDRPTTLPFAFANLGGSHRAPATVNLSIPAGVSVTGLTPDGWSCTAPTAAPVAGPSTLVCSPTTALEKGSVAELALPVIVSAGGVAVSARIAGEMHDSDLSNNEHIIAIETSAAAAGITLSKSDGVTAVIVGQQLDYTITVSNPLGFEPLSGVTVTDTLPAGVEFVAASAGGTSAGGVVTWTIAEIAAAASTEVTVTARVLETAANQIANTATVSAADPGFPGVTLTGIASDTDVVDRITLSKTGVLAQPAEPQPGDVVSYTFVAHNAGGGPLSGVAITDPMVGLSAIAINSWPTLPGHLGAGQSVTGTAEYVLTQADINAGLVTNTANVSAVSDNGAAVVATATDERTLPGRPALTLQKEGSIAATPPRSGEPVRYSFTVRNTGNVTVGNIAIADALPGLSALTFGTWPGAPGQLAFGESVTATATYPLTQGDLDRGSVVNTATASGDGANGEPASANDTVTVPLPIAPALSLSKTGVAGNPNGTTAGDIISYTFTVSNTGNVTATGVVITDPLAGLSPISYGVWPASSGVLRPGESVTATASYTSTQEDVDAGRVNNTASVAGEGPGDLPLGAIASTTVSIPADPSISLSKTGVVGAAVPNAGDTIDYSFIVTNTGSLTVDGISITDPLDGIAAIAFGAWPGAEGILAPTESVEATASYVLSQADIDYGRLDNTATADGEAANGALLEAIASDTVSFTSAPALSLRKSGTVSGTSQAGDAVTFEFVIENTGNVSLKGVALVDELDGLGPIEFGDWPGDDSVLKPGEQVSATAAYPISQADLDAGFVANEATASAAGVRGGSPSAQAETTVPLAAAPAVTLVKTGSLAEATPGIPAAGDVISYSFEATNEGNVTVSGIALVDGLAGLSEIVFGTWPGVSGSLAPGQTVTATADYALSQADLDAGAVYNVAALSGLGVRGGAVLVEDDTTTMLAAEPSLSFEKTGTASAPERPLAGQAVLFSFVVVNTGNVTVSGVSITDELAGLGDVDFDSWPAAFGVLAPGAQVTATAGYTLSQSDVDSGRIENTAVVTAIPVRGDELSVPATTTVPLAASPGLTLLKSAALADANGDGLANPGERIAFSFTAENSGNVTLSDVVVNDAMVTGTPVVGALAPGEVVTVSAELYTVLAADTVTGELVNIATASGRTPAGEVVESEQSRATVAAAETQVPVTPATAFAPAELASTGFNPAGLGLASGLLLAAGLLFLQFSIRRRRSLGQR